MTFDSKVKANILNSVYMACEVVHTWDATMVMARSNYVTTMWYLMKVQTCGKSLFID